VILGIVLSVPLKLPAETVFARPLLTAALRASAHTDVALRERKDRRLEEGIDTHTLQEGNLG